MKSKKIESYPGQRQRLVPLLEVTGDGGFEGQFRTRQLMRTLETRAEERRYSV